MFESIAAITISIKEVLTSMSIKRFLIWTFFILIVTLLIFYIYESYTGNFYFSRVNKKIDLISKIDNLVEGDSLMHKNIVNELNVIVSEVSNYKTKKGFDEKVIFSKNLIEGLFKFLTALIVPLIIIIYSLYEKDETERKNMMFGGILIGLIGGLVAIFIPTIYQPWVNYIGFPVIEFVILAIIGSLTD